MAVERVGTLREAKRMAATTRTLAPTNSQVAPPKSPNAPPGFSVKRSSTTPGMSWIGARPSRLASARTFVRRSAA
jgi:hypothetical protein